MNPLIFIGYEIREKFGNDPMNPIPNYPLGVGNVTMDSNLCRPCANSGYWIRNRKIFFYDSYESIRKIFLSMRDWAVHRQGKAEKTKTRSDYRIFGYFIEEEFIVRFAQMEKKIFGEEFVYFRREKIIEEAPPESMEVLGFDVVRGLFEYDRWESELANEGIPLEALNRHGTLNNSGLYTNIGNALSFKKELLIHSKEGNDDLPFVVKIMG